MDPGFPRAVTLSESDLSSTALTAASLHRYFSLVLPDC